MLPNSTRNRRGQPVQLFDVINRALIVIQLNQSGIGNVDVTDVLGNHVRGLRIQCRPGRLARERPCLGR
jgi:hypothetical protein